MLIGRKQGSSIQARGKFASMQTPVKGQNFHKDLEALLLQFHHHAVHGSNFIAN